MKKILIFTTAYLPFVGGAELAIKEITDRLSPSEFSFDLITVNLDGKQKPEEKVGNVRVIRLSCPKLLFPFLALVCARALHLENPYDRVWSIMASYGGFAGLFFKLRFPKVPFILTLQEGDSFAHIYRRVFFVWPLFKMIFTRADKITAISTYLAEWARRMGAKAHISIIPNGVDVKNFQFPISNFQKGEIRKRLNIKPEEKVVITTSRLVKKNAVDDLIKSIQYLPDTVKLIIAGSGDLEKELKLEARTLKLEPRVKFVGFLPHNELPRYLHAADIFCRPSRSEGMGSSFIEAMAAGLPVIATPVGGIPDFLSAPLPRSSEEELLSANSHELADESHQGITGLFCKVGDPKDIAEKIQLLLDNLELRERIIINGSKMVRERYEWEGIARNMREVLTDSA